MIPPLLHVALDFYRDPRRFGQLRDPRRPLPDGVSELLGAPAGCLGEGQAADTEAATGASVDELREAVTFFAKQVLLEPAADHYRTLGVSRDADAGLIRQHYYALMRLFHPDRDVAGEGWDDLYAPRINEAHHVLRHPERRAAYDATLPERDGFNPEELERGPAVAPGESMSRPQPPRGTGMAPSLVLQRRWYTRPWPWAAVVIGALALLLGLQWDGPADDLRITAPAADAGAAAGGRARAAGSGGAAPGAGTSAIGETGIPSGAPVTEDADGGLRPVWTAEATSDERIEALVRERVEQATIAALGAPQPAPTQPPRPASEPELSLLAEVTPVAGPRRRLEPLPEPAGPLLAEVALQAGARLTPAPFPARKLPVVTAPVTPLEPVALRAGPPLSPKPFPAVAAAAPPLETVTLLAGPRLRPKPFPRRGPAPVTDDQIATLMARLILSYERGDAGAFAGLFTRDATTTDADGRDAIEDLYGDFFATLAGSRFELRGVDWSAPAPERRGEGEATILTQPKNDGATNTVRLTMRFTVRREGDAVRISAMDYE